MMHSLFWVIWFLFPQTTVPYKPSDEFQVEVEYQLKQKPSPDQSTLDFEETRAEHDKRHSQAGPLPFLVIHLRVKKLGEGEVRIRALNNAGSIVLQKKAVAGESYRITMGFTDDLKDRVTPHEFNLFFLSDKKVELSRVNLFITEDGAFLVNGEKRGKF